MLLTFWFAEFRLSILQNSWSGGVSAPKALLSLTSRNGMPN